MALYDDCETVMAKPSTLGLLDGQDISNRENHLGKCAMRGSPEDSKTAYPSLRTERAS